MQPRNTLGGRKKKRQSLRNEMEKVKEKARVPNVIRDTNGKTNSDRVLQRAFQTDSVPLPQHSGVWFRCPQWTREDTPVSVPAAESRLGVRSPSGLSVFGDI